MKQLFFLIFLFTIVLSANLYAQLFTRTAEINEPSGLDRGFGGIIAGVDFDQDGLPEIYACNTNMVDAPYEIIPRIYKFEWNRTNSTWDSVWAAIAPYGLIDQQNTWNSLVSADLDQDNKPELIWMPVNYLDANSNPNPARILVYEYPGDGSNNMGVSDGLGGFIPNAHTSIVNLSMFDLRPIRTVIMDIDQDNTQEIIFSDRRASVSDWHVGVVSVDDIPDQGNGTENWTVEFNGVGDINLSGTSDKWDLAVLDNYIYLFNNSGLVSILKYENNAWQTLPGQSGIAGGNSSFKGAQVYDVDGNGTKEIVVGEWLNNTPGQGANVWLLQQVGDSLTSMQIANLEPLGAVRLCGSGVGDLDNDGNVDFVFGSRYDINNSKKVPIFRLEYQGGDITNPANWISSVIDTNYWNNNGDMDVIYVANVDGDPADEVLYTQGYSRGNPTDAPMPIIVLDLVYTPVPVELVSFNAFAEGYDVTLSWITATEINNRGFEIERSDIYSAGTENEWSMISFINGKGTTTEIQNYSFIDKDLIPSNYRYRLKQIDLDGSYTYSNEILVEVSIPLTFSLEQNYPNPFNPSTIIEFGINKNSIVDLRVYDLLGKEVSVIIDRKYMEAGKYSKKFDVKELASGIYIYNLKSDDLSITKKMQILK
ncbi:MAG: T9SS type A sorting domain-containing protein [Ignavibacteriaceae bacterium]